MCWLVREFGIVTSSVFLPHEVSDFTSPLRRIGAVIRGEDSHFFLARLVVRSPSLSRGGVVNVKTLIVMSCDTSEGRRRGQVGRQAGRHADRHTAGTKLQLDLRFEIDKG